MPVDNISIHKLIDDHEGVHDGIDWQDWAMKLVMMYSRNNKVDFSTQKMESFFTSLWEDYSVRRTDKSSLQKKIQHSSISKELKKFLFHLIELINCLRRDNNKKLPKFNSPTEVLQLFGEMNFLENELLKVIFLDVENQLIMSKNISLGGENKVWVSPRAIMEASLQCRCRKIILLHNHPSGHLEPSEEDIVFTRKIEQATKILGIKLLDHIILGDVRSRYYSFAEHRLL